MHSRRLSLFGFALLGLTIAFLQLLAMRYFLYFELWWYDVIMHFLGGAFIALGYFWALRFELSPRLSPAPPVFLSALAVTLAIGVSWELFEYVTGMYLAVNYTLDTTLDLLMDVVGMMAAYLVFKRI